MNIEKGQYQFIQPSIEGESSASESKFEPKGLSQVAAYLHEYIKEKRIQENEKVEEEVLPNFEVVDQSIDKRDIEKILKSKEQIGNRPYFVFLSMLGPCARNALEIAKQAKERGAIVVAGNDHATQRYKQILSTGLIDYAFLGDNVHQHVAKLVEVLDSKNEEDLRKIPFLAYRDKDGNIVENKVEKREIVSRAIDPQIDRVLNEQIHPIENIEEIRNIILRDKKMYVRINKIAQQLAGARNQDKIRQWILNTTENLPEEWKSKIVGFGDLSRSRKLHKPQIVKQATIDIAKGCRGGLERKPCLFCSICDVRKMETVKPEAAVELAVEMAKMGYNFLYITADDLTSFAPRPTGNIAIDLDKSYLGKLAHLWETTEFEKEGKKVKLNGEVELYAYAQAHNIARLPELIPIMKKMNIIRLNIGFESGSDAILLGMGKTATVKENLDTVKLLKEEGIQLHTSFVLGSIGETKETLRDTLSHTKEIIEYSKNHEIKNNIVVLEPSVLFPAFNNKAWEMLTDYQRAIEELSYFLDQLKHYAKSSERNIDLKLIPLLENRINAYKTEGIKERERLINITNKWKKINETAPYIEDTKQLVKDWIDLFCFVSYEDIQKTMRQIEEEASRAGIGSGTFAGVKGTTAEKSEK